MTRFHQSVRQPQHGRVFGPNAGGRRFPASGAEFTALTGLTASSLYLFDEASGSVLDKIGTADLAVSATPLFNVIVSGRRCIDYNSASDAHTADVHDLGVGSGIYLGVCAINSGTTTTGLFGRGNAGLTESCHVYMNVPATGKVGAMIRDDGANSLVIGLNSDYRSIGLVLYGLQIDRAAGTATLRASRPGVGAETASGSIAGFSTLTGASQAYRHGTLLGIGVGNGSQHGWGAVLTGAQCEGVSVLQNIARSLGWE